MSRLLTGKCSRTPQGVRGLKYQYQTSGKRNIPWSHPARGAWIEISIKIQDRSGKSSHPARGAWIEIADDGYSAYRWRCRTPQGVRGLKYSSATVRSKTFEGRTPQGVRGLKSEPLTQPQHLKERRTPQGVRGLKCDAAVGGDPGLGRTPQGVRGLKSRACPAPVRRARVAPRKGCVD